MACETAHTRVSMLGSVAIAIFIAFSPLRAQMDTLPLSITDDEQYLRFLNDASYLSNVLLEIDSLTESGPVDLCTTIGGSKRACTKTVDTLTQSAELTAQVIGIQTIFHTPFEALGRIPSTRPINATDFGHAGLDHNYFVLFPPWVPVRLTASGVDSIMAWEEKLRHEQGCVDARFCRVIIREVRRDTLTSALTALSDCYVAAGASGGVPQRCNLLAVWDGDEWWIRGILGYVLLEGFDLSQAGSMTENMSAAQDLQSLLYMYDARAVDRFASGDFDLVVRGRVDEGYILAAVSRALSAVPRPSLETTQHLGAIIGSANRRVSPVLEPYREIVDVMVLVRPQSGAYVLWVRPSVLVNRYNDGSDRSYHLPNPADAQRYRTVLLETLRAHLSEICDRPSWSAQIMTCND